MPFKKAPELHSIWVGMRQRCRNRNHRVWHRYGGRGITICERWESYAAFEADMAPRPPGTTLDRIDNNGNYSPENCRWASHKIQNRNQTCTRLVTIEGVVYTAADLADVAGLKTDTIVIRAASGLSMSDVVSSDRRVFKPGLALGGLANGRRQRAKTHCKAGHAFSEGNTTITPQGWRRCKACHAAKMRRLKAAARSAAVSRHLATPS